MVIYTRAALSMVQKEVALSMLYKRIACIKQSAWYTNTRGSVMGDN